MPGEPKGLLKPFLGAPSPWAAATAAGRETVWRPYLSVLGIAGVGTRQGTP